MAYGLWGGRLPIANLIVSRSLFATVRLLRFSRRVQNGLRRRLRPARLALVNTPEVAAALSRFLDLGYDRLNVGGGSKNLAGYVNIDFALDAGVDRQVQANILDLSFVPDACASRIHSNHVLEHLSAEQLVRQLREYRRILRPAGRLSIRCPNALGAAYGFWFRPVIEQHRERFLALGYPADDDLANPADDWMHQDVLGLMHWFHGDPGNARNQHLSLITPTRMRDLLESCGFRVLLLSEPEAVNLVAIAERGPESGGGDSPDRPESVPIGVAGAQPS